jgi:hypothetical protein
MVLGTKLLGSRQSGQIIGCWQDGQDDLRLGELGAGKPPHLDMARRYRNRDEIRAALFSEFPRLAASAITVKSPWDDDYQCIAWAECNTDRKSWPGDGYAWPKGLPLADPPETATTDHFIPRFSLLGYEPSGLDSSFALGYQKVAIYANDQGVTHMARQHLLGFGWLSKLGKMEDILHANLEDLEGDMAVAAYGYGKVVMILRRSWWSAIVRLCVFRCIWNALGFWLCRLTNDWEMT